MARTEMKRMTFGSGITPTAYSAPRMSPAVSLRLPAPPLFRCAEHAIDVIQCGRGGSLHDTASPVPRALGVPRSEIKEEAEGRGTFAEGDAQWPRHAPPRKTHKFVEH